jgi:hypothetical protein
LWYEGTEELNFLASFVKIWRKVKGWKGVWRWLLLQEKSLFKMTPMTRVPALLLWMRRQESPPCSRSMMTMILCARYERERKRKREGGEGGGGGAEKERERERMRYMAWMEERERAREVYGL